MRITTYLTLLVTSLILPALDAEAARYRLVVSNTWNEATHPALVPEDAHFSWLGGATHDAAVSFWQEGQPASPGIQEMAESGATFILLDEVQDAVDTGSAGAALDWMHWFCPPATTNSRCGPLVVEFDIDESHPLVSLATMLGPSPDWFVGVSGLALRASGQWLPQVSVELFPYDGGTRDANVFALGGPLTTPAAPIELITRAAGQLVGPQSLGSFTFTLISDEPATFQAAFETTWSSEDVDSGERPLSAHFTRLVGTTHTPATSLWLPGAIASTGVENVAEVGSTGALQGEIAALQSSGDAGDFLDLDDGFAFPAVSTTSLNVEPANSRLSLISMVAPSPDWFVGVAALPLQDTDSWIDRRNIPLRPYDAGTEDGNGFSLINPDSVPREPIAPLIDSPFVGRPTIARLHLLRVPAGPGPNAPCGDLNSDSTVDLSDVVVFRRYLANPNGAILFDGDPSRCTTIAPSGSCDVTDATALIRGVAGRAPGIDPLCSAAGL